MSSILVFGAVDLVVPKTPKGLQNKAFFAGRILTQKSPLSNQTQWGLRETAE